LAVVADSEEQLAWEARQRPRAGIASIASAVLLVGSLIWAQSALRNLPSAGFLTSLGQAFKAGPAGDQPSLLTPVFQFYVDHSFTFVGSTVLQTLGYLGLAFALTFLGMATRARRPETSRIVIYIALIGALLLAVAAVFGEIGRSTAFPAFLDSQRTIDDARDIGTNALVAVSQLLEQLVPLLLGAGILLLALNAMRVGLLTRFLGILGMIAGGLTVFQQFFVFAPFILAVWLVATGLMELNFGRAGAPPAWRTGKAEPWPSQREVAAARRAAGSPQKAEPERAQAPTGTRPHPASKKRKRKRRG
jgi:Domain of unknown function (DUF4386)